MNDDLPTTFYPPNTNEPTSPPPVSQPSDIPLSPPPPTMPEPTITTGFAEEKPHSKKKVVVAALALILVVASTAAAVYLAGQRQEVRKKAEDICNYRPANPNHPCNDHAPGWSTCGPDPTQSGTIHRWGCDQACNYQDLENPWCEGTTKKFCETNGDITVTPNDSTKCGYSPGGNCAGKEKGSYCDGVGDRNGMVRVLNCTDEIQEYRCQTNHTTFSTPGTCDAADKTDQKTGESTLRVNPGEYGECSVSPDGCCGIGQADITTNVPAVCWDTAKTCTCCGTTPTPGGLSCSSLTKQPAGTGGSINLTCTGSGQGIDHFEFRKKIGDGNYETIGTATPVAGENHASIRTSVTEYGCYTVECRACAGATCTEWGKAQ